MLVWIGFSFRLFNIQIINKLNSPQGIKVETVKGLRGNFFDINGRNLTQNLTFYRKTVSNVSSRFNKFSKNWWKRRMQAHQFFQKFSKDNELDFNKNFDFLLTKIICKFL